MGNFLVYEYYVGAEPADSIQAAKVKSDCMSLLSRRLTLKIGKWYPWLAGLGHDEVLGSRGFS